MGTACENVHMIWTIFKRTFQPWTGKVGPFEWVYRIFFICKFARHVIFLLFISYRACQRVLLPDKSLVGFAPGPHWGHSPRPPYIGYRSAITIFGPLNQIPASTLYLIKAFVGSHREIIFCTFGPIYGGSGAIGRTHYSDPTRRQKANKRIRLLNIFILTSSFLPFVVHFHNFPSLISCDTT